MCTKDTQPEDTHIVERKQKIHGNMRTENRGRQLVMEMKLHVDTQTKDTHIVERLKL